MTDSFAPIWGKSRIKAPRRPGVTSAATDSESGDDRAGVERDLYALDTLYRRGLIPKNEYEKRRAELVGS